MISFNRLSSLCAIVSCCIVSSQASGYLDRNEAMNQSRKIIHRLFAWPELDREAQQKVNDFANDFAKNTFTSDSNYSQFNETNVAQMTLDAAVEWVCEQARGIAAREAVSNHIFNPHFNGQNYRNLEPLKKSISISIKNQITRISKKPLERINSGDFYAFIGGGLIQKVRDQMQEIISRDCAAYCGEDSTKLLLLNCGHKLHDSCLHSLQKAECPICRDNIAYARPPKSAAYSAPKPSNYPPYQAQPVYNPSYQPQPARPAYNQPTQSAPTLREPITPQEAKVLAAMTIGGATAALIYVILTSGK